MMHHIQSPSLTWEERGSYPSHATITTEEDTCIIFPTPFMPVSITASISRDDDTITIAMEGKGDMQSTITFPQPVSTRWDTAKLYVDDDKRCVYMVLPRQE